MVDPVAPQRDQLARIAGGDYRLLIALERLFEVAGKTTPESLAILQEEINQNAGRIDDNASDITANTSAIVLNEAAVAIALAASGVYANRAAFLAATINPVIVRASYIEGDRVLSFVADAGGTAATTADGRTWSPDGEADWRHFGVVLLDRASAAANSVNINKAVAWCGANNVRLRITGIAFSSGDGVFQDVTCEVYGDNLKYWNKNGVASTNLIPLSLIVMTGTTTRNKTMFGISSCQSWGGKISNPSPVAGYNDADYVLSSFINPSATADGQTLRQFSAAWHMTKNAEGSVLWGFAVIPDGGGAEGMDYYQTGTTAVSTPLTSGDCDVGLFVNAAKSIRVNCQFTGQWRMRKGLLAVPHSDTFPATLYRAKFDGSVFSGLAVRGPDHAPVIATTATTFDIPFADDHPFTAGGATQVRLSSGGRDSDTFTLNGAPVIVPDGVASGIDSLRFTVVEDPTGKTGCLPAYRGGGTSGLSFHGAQIIGFGHGSLEPSENSALAGFGPYLSPMNTIEISGNEITEVDMSLAELETYETVSVYLGDCRHVTLPTYIEANGNGSRIIYWGPRATNPNTVHPTVPATSETMEPHFTPKGSTLLGGNIDLRPYIQDFDAPARFGGGSDDGLMVGIRNNSPKHGLHAYMDIGSVVMAPAGGVAALGRRIGSGDFLAPSISDYDVALEYDDTEDEINSYKPTYRRDVPHFTGVTFTGAGGAGTVLYVSGDRVEVQIPANSVAILAMSGEAENITTTVSRNQTSSGRGLVTGKTDGAPGIAVGWSVNSFAATNVDLDGTTANGTEATIVSYRVGQVQVQNLGTQSIFTVHVQT